MVIKYHISSYPSLHEAMVVKIYEASNTTPGAEVYTETLPERNGAGVPTPGAGQQVKSTITANGLDKVVHVVRLYSAVSVALLQEYNAEPTNDLVVIFDPIRFKIGDGGVLTPVANTREYVDVLLHGLTDNEYCVHRNNYGFLFPVTHYVNDSVNDKFVLNSPDAFLDGEEFTIFRKSKVITSVVNDSVVGKYFAGYVDVNSNMSYSSSHLRKLLRFTGTFTYEFLVTDAVPIGYGFCFQHFGNTLGVGKVKFSNAPLLWGTTTKSEIDIPSYHEAMFVFDGASWNVFFLCDSTWVNGQTINPGYVLGFGNVNVGDVPAGDPVYAIVHNLNIAGDYIAFVSIKSNAEATYFRNNKICNTWYHHATDKPNRFWVSLQEITGEAQDLSITWIIIKI